MSATVDDSRITEFMKEVLNPFDKTLSVVVHDLSPRGPGDNPPHPSDEKRCPVARTYHIHGT
jgi:hypothetical protein